MIDRSALRTHSRRTGSRLRTVRRAEERGTTLIELIVAITIMAAIAGVVTALFITGIQSSDRISADLPGPRGANSLALVLTSDITSATPVDPNTWLSTDARVDTGCKGGPPGTTENVLRIETRDPVGSGEVYVASYRIEQPTAGSDGARLWRTFCRSGQEPTSVDVVATGIDPDSGATAEIDADGRSARVRFNVLVKGRTYQVTVGAAIRTSAGTPTVEPGPTTTLPPRPVCQADAAVIADGLKSTVADGPLKEPVAVVVRTSEEGTNACTRLVLRLSGNGGPECELTRADASSWTGACFGPATKLSFPASPASWPLVLLDRVEGGDLPVAGPDLSLPIKLPPAAPTNVVVTPGDGRLVVSWTAPVLTSNTPAVTSYTATATPGNAVCTSTSATTCSITGLVNGTTYSIRVTATNAVGTGVPSAAVSSAPRTPLTISGQVFEDVNYGGGAGRSRDAALAAGGALLANVRVELYSVQGTTATFLAATTTDAKGFYRFGSPACSSCAVRAVGATVASSRTSTVRDLRAVPTYLTRADSSGVVPVADRVGGMNPASTVDDAAATTGATFDTVTGSFPSKTAGTAQAVALLSGYSGDATSVDFGFNFDTVVNTNDAGPGSLRQVITNANALGDDDMLVQSGRATRSSTPSS